MLNIHAVLSGKTAQSRNLTQMRIINDFAETKVKLRTELKAASKTTA